MPNRPPATLDWLVLLLLALIWGASFLFIKRAVTVFSPVQMAMWRMVIATGAYIPLAVAYWSKIDWKKWKPLVVVALFGSAIPNFFFAVAQQHVSSSLAGVLNSLTPLFTLVLGVTFFKMKVPWSKAVGVILGLSGAAILILNNSGVQAGGHYFFAFLCIMATVCYAINANSLNKYLREMHPAAIGAASFMITGGFFVVGLFLSGGWQVVWQNPKGLEALSYVGYLAIMGTAVGSIMYFWLLQRTGPIFATSVTYLLPVSALAIGAIDGEAIGLFDLVGTGVILTGLYLARKG